MDLIGSLGPIRTALCWLAVHPIRLVVSPSGGGSAPELRPCRWRQVYSLAVFVVLLPCMYASIQQAVHFIFSRDRDSNRSRLQISNLVQMVQVTLLMVAYMWVLLFGQWASARKCAFVNALHRNAAIVWWRPIVRRMYGECVAYNALHLVFIVWMSWLVEDASLSVVLLVLLVLTVNLEMLYMRALAKVLVARFRAVRRRLAAALAEPQRFAQTVSLELDRLEHLDGLKRLFQRIVGAFLGVHFLVDLMLVTLLLFVIWYYSVYVGGMVIYMVSVAAMGARVVPVGVKMWLLVRPFEQLAQEVSDDQIVVVMLCIWFWFIAGCLALCNCWFY